MRHASLQCQTASKYGSKLQTNRTLKTSGSHSQYDDHMLGLCAPLTDDCTALGSEVRRLQVVSTMPSPPPIVQHESTKKVPPWTCRRHDSCRQSMAHSRSPRPAGHTPSRAHENPHPVTSVQRIGARQTTTSRWCGSGGSMTVMGSSGATGPPFSTMLMMPAFRSSFPSGVPRGIMSCACTHDAFIGLAEATPVGPQWPSLQMRDCCCDAFSPCQAALSGTPRSVGTGCAIL